MSVASRSAAAPRAHLRAIKSRMVGGNDGIDSNSKNHNERDTEEVMFKFESWLLIIHRLSLCLTV